MSDNGWVTITKKERKPKDPTRSYQEPEPPAKKYDDDVVILRKKTGPPTKQVSKAVLSNRTTSSGFNARKIDENTYGGAHKKVSLSMGQLMQQALAAKGWSQKDLVAQVGGRAKVNLQDVQNIATGKAILHNDKITAIEKTLNFRLRGKNVGQPFFGPKKPKNEKK